MKAFTLVEMLLVLVLMGVVAALAWPSLTSYFALTDDRVLQSALVQMLNQARQLALTRHQRVLVCRSQDQRACSGAWLDGWIVYADTEGDGVLHQESQRLIVVRHTSSQGHLYWRAYPKYRDTLMFDPAILSTVSNGTFWYCRYRASAPSWALVVSRTGMSRLQLPDSEGQLHDSQGRVLGCVTNSR